MGPRFRGDGNRAGVEINHRKTLLGAPPRHPLNLQQAELA